MVARNRDPQQERRFTATRRVGPRLVVMLVTEDDFELLEEDRSPRPWRIRGWNTESTARAVLEHRATRCVEYEIAEDGSKMCGLIGM